MSTTANEPRRKIWTNRWMWPWFAPFAVFYGGLAILLLLTCTQMGHYLIEGWPHGRSYETLQRSLNALRMSVPKGVDPAAWEHDVDWTSNLIGNCCQRTQVWNERTGYRSFFEFSEEFARQCASDPDCDTIGWIWDTMPTVSTNGAQYQHWRTELRACRPLPN